MLIPQNMLEAFGTHDVSARTQCSVRASRCSAQSECSVSAQSASCGRVQIRACAATIIEGRRHKKEPQAGYALGVGSSLVVSLRLLGLSGQGAVEAGGLAAQPGLMHNT
jgi:hypothetical protein